MLAEVYGKEGRVEEGLKVLNEVLATVQKTRERFYEAELYRLKGTLTAKVSSLRFQVSRCYPSSP